MWTWHVTQCRRCLKGLNCSGGRNSKSSFSELGNDSGPAWGIGYRVERLMFRGSGLSVLKPQINLNILFIQKIWNSKNSAIVFHWAHTMIVLKCFCFQSRSRIESSPMSRTWKRYTIYTTAKASIQAAPRTVPSSHRASSILASNLLRKIRQI